MLLWKSVLENCSVEEVAAGSCNISQRGLSWPWVSLPVSSEDGEPAERASLTQPERCMCESWSWVCCCLELFEMYWISVWNQLESLLGSLYCEVKLGNQHLDSTVFVFNTLWENVGSSVELWVSISHPIMDVVASVAVVPLFYCPASLIGEMKSVNLPNNDQTKEECLASTRLSNYKD